jgi:3',5'-cyclic AMP phosphodiesterase CpdA
MRWQSIRGLRLPRSVAGIGLIAVSVLAIAAPATTGTWSLQLLGLLVLGAGLTELHATATNAELRARPLSYLTSLPALATGGLLLLSPALVATGVVGLVLGFLAIDGGLNVGQALFARRGHSGRAVTAVNGAWLLLLAFIGWILWRNISLEMAIGVVVAGYTAAVGWRTLLSPHSQREKTDTPDEANVHPDASLELGKHKLLGAMTARYSASIADVRRVEAYWLLVAGVALFATHLGRMQSADTWLGLVSPFVATAGDIIMAVAAGFLLILPLRLGWRRLTRPLERQAWQMRLSGEDAHMKPLLRWLIRLWTDVRFSFSALLRNARVSLLAAGELALRLGLPVALFFVAINPIWGFTWYFNTESWASGFYQKMAELRIDPWRSSMIDAVRSAYGGHDHGLFQVMPNGIEDGDFSFIVIGDPGEGDASQYALVERYLELARRDDVKFLVIASDVVYPAGAMTDYESHFYMPFKGVAKPIYAIPGNHDWFDALEGFNANFLEPKAARAALAARVKADLGFTSTGEERIDRLLQRARQLREYYGIQIASQRGPFFELQTKDFALIAIDTGIRRTIDNRQRAWLDDALARSSGKFTMAIVGHPKFAAGQDTSRGEVDFRAIYSTLEQAGVRVMMAGDTHAFEYYLAKTSEGRNPIHHFVNGGGGAYLSIGGALAWPELIPTKTWAFYPSPEAIRAKLDRETPTWKQPFWQWIKHFGAWPVSIETLSGMFDFNKAPFFQSFMEVRVERSKQRVVFALHGTTGPVRWRDLHIHRDDGLNEPPDEPVQFVVALRVNPKASD